MTLANLAIPNDAKDLLPYLTPQEQEQAIRLIESEQRAALGIPLNKYIPHLPTPKQLEAMRLDDILEVFYGGAAGGGKSEWLLMSALQYVDVARYSALLLRRTYADLSLPGALMDRAREWMARPEARDAKWNTQEKTWQFPSGATLTFGYLENEADKYRYQSSEFQFIGFDEVTQFEESQYLYLFSRLRRLSSSDVPLRMRAASNPDGIGFDWVKKRFVTTPDASRRFVAAKLDDNPFLDKGAYSMALDQLDPLTRERLREGSWDERQGTEIRREWFEIVPRLPDGVREQCRAWDLALTLKQTDKPDPDYTASVGGAMANGWLYLVNPMRFRAEMPDILWRIKDHKKLYPFVRLGIAKDLAAKSAKQMLEREGIGIEEYEETKDIRARCAAFVSFASRGLVKLVGDPKDWEEFLAEATAAFTGKHDDLLAACAGLTQMFGLVIQAPRTLVQPRVPQPHPFAMKL